MDIGHDFFLIGEVGGLHGLTDHFPQITLNVDGHNASLCKAADYIEGEIIAQEGAEMDIACSDIAERFRGEGIGFGKDTLSTVVAVGAVTVFKKHRLPARNHLHLNSVGPKGLHHCGLCRAYGSDESEAPMVKIPEGLGEIISSPSRHIGGEIGSDHAIEGDMSDATEIIWCFFHGFNY